MSAYVIFDVEIHDPLRYQEYMTKVALALERAGGKYLARGGDLKVYEGDWKPHRIVIFEFPSMEAWDKFYNSPTYHRIKAIRDECSTARLICVDGLK
ncbi:MAG: DUF1330 domain-containing protein [Xanthobacteraceae bacterium]